MRIFSRNTLKGFWEANPRSEQALKAWFAEAQTAECTSPADVKAKYGSASILKEWREVLTFAVTILG